MFAPFRNLQRSLHRGLPEYPWDSGLPAWPTARVLAWVGPDIERLRRESGLERGLFDRILLPSVSRFAAAVHLLPGGPAGKPYAEAAGLLRYGLEYAVWGLRVLEERVPFVREAPAERRRRERAWRGAVVMGALCRAAMAAWQIEVTGAGERWHPHGVPLDRWCAARRLRRYRIVPAADAPPAAAVRGFRLARLLPVGTVEWLAAEDPLLLAAFPTAVACAETSRHPMGGILVAAQPAAGVPFGQADSPDSTGGAPGGSEPGDPARAWLDRLLQDSGGEESLRHSGEALAVRYPDAFAGPDDPAALLAALREKGWIACHDGNPLQSLQVLDGERWVVLAGEAAARLQEHFLSKGVSHDRSF